RVPTKAGVGRAWPGACPARNRRGPSPPWGGAAAARGGHAAVRAIYRPGARTQLRRYPPLSHGQGRRGRRYPLGRRPALVVLGLSRGAGCFRTSALRRWPPVAVQSAEQVDGGLVGIVKLVQVRGILVATVRVQREPDHVDPVAQLVQQQLLILDRLMDQSCLVACRGRRAACILHGGLE